MISTETKTKTKTIDYTKYFRLKTKVNVANE